MATHMKKVTLLTLLTLLSAFLGVAQESTAPAKAKKPSVTNTSSESITGKLGYISDKKITVKAKGAEASTTFLIDSATKITLNGEPKAVTDLKKGWNASVTPSATNLPTAAVISVTKAAGTAESPAKTEE